jgi:hypothetical protein
VGKRGRRRREGEGERESEREEESAPITGIPLCPPCPPPSLCLRSLRVFLNCQARGAEPVGKSGGQWANRTADP